MRYLIIALAALVLAGCASTTPIEGSAQPGRAGGVYVVGTLAPWGSFEHRAAPLYTRNAVVRRTAARELERGAITLPAAREVLHLTDEARAVLDAAVRDSAGGDAARADAGLARARELIDQAGQLVGR